jgi:hypothetical protein
VGNEKQLMRTPRSLLVTTVLGMQLSWVAIGGAQTVEPVAEPPSQSNQPLSSSTEPPHEVQPSSDREPSSEGLTNPSHGTKPGSSQKSGARRPDKAALDEAKRAYSAGERAYNARDYKGAIENFQIAQGVLPTPQAGYWLALSLQAAGQVPEAIAAYKTLLYPPWSDRLTPEKLAGAKAALEELNRTPGTISLSTEPVGATVSVDGEVRPGVSPLRVELQPGVHTLIISMPGYKSMELEFEVPPGSKGEQKLALTALPPSPPTASGAPAVPAARSKRVVVHTAGAISAKPSNIGEYVVFGLAGAGAIVGTIFGIRALGEKSDKSPANDTADRDEAIAGVGFGAAITFGLAGIVMATVTDGLPAGHEKVVASRSIPTHREVLFVPYLTAHSGGGASAVWRF